MADAERAGGAPAVWTVIRYTPAEADGDAALDDLRPEYADVVALDDAVAHLDDPLRKAEP